MYPVLAFGHSDKTLTKLQIYAVIILDTLVAQMKSGYSYLSKIDYKENY